LEVVSVRQLGPTVLATALTCGSPAFAQTAQPTPAGETSAPVEPSPARSTSIWYGYQTLACDVASVVLFASGIAVVDASKSPVVGATISAAGGFVYVFGPPIVHLAHGRDPAAVMDTAIRLALPFVGLFVGAGISLKVEGDGSFAAEELGVPPWASRLPWRSTPWCLRESRSAHRR
jgi:hypothetical protein